VLVSLQCFSRQDSLVRHNRLLHEKDGRGRVGSNGKPLPPASFRNRSPKGESAVTTTASMG
jgi:hypothetical protein